MNDTDTIRSDPKLKPATKYCQCAACGEYFTNVYNFDMHRAGLGQNRRCIDPAELVNKKGKAQLQRNASGYWARMGNIERLQHRKGSHSPT